MNTEPTDTLALKRQADYLSDQLRTRVKGLPRYLTDLLFKIDAAAALEYLDAHEAKLRGMPLDDTVTDVELAMIKRFGITKEAYLKAKNSPLRGDQLKAQIEQSAKDAMNAREAGNQ